jgi:glycosyltransferase involved in cell wall biosynthesis
LHYVLFSQFEKTLYAKAFSFDENRMVYLPYGDLSDLETQADAEVQLVKEPDDSRCFFSGGYSNRDYLSLIETFRSLPFKLIIVCSALNTEIREAIIPPNVKVLREVSSRLFDAYVKSAKACIIPIAHNTGAAGQSCLLRYMKNRKIIIATDTDVIREYITDGVSGILVNDNHESMASAIRAVNANTEGYRCYAEAAYESYARHFSGEALARQLDQMLDQGRERDGN